MSNPRQSVLVERLAEATVYSEVFDARKRRERDQQGGAA